MIAQTTASMTRSPRGRHGQPRTGNCTADWTTPGRKEGVVVIRNVTIGRVTISLYVQYVTQLRVTPFDVPVLVH
eukprot:1350897-Amorphochlora_amoeboformis.AAC.1